MLLPVATIAALLIGAPATKATSVAVLPVEFDGELEAHWRTGFARAVATGLERGQFAATPVEDATCSDAACFARTAAELDAAFVVRAQVEVVEYDYDLAVTLYQAEDGVEVSAARRRCELCGAKEAIEAMESLAASMRSRVDQLTKSIPELSITSAPPGATVTIDGTFVGKTPVSVQFEPGPHDVDLYLDGHEPRSLNWNAVPGVADRRAIELAPTRRQKRARPVLVAGGVLLGTGLGLVPAGAVLVAIDGRQYRRGCRPDINDMCPNTYETLGGGIALLVGGVVSAAVGVALVAVAHRRKRRAALRYFPSVASRRASRPWAWFEPSSSALR